VDIQGHLDSIAALAKGAQKQRAEKHVSPEPEAAEPAPDDGQAECEADAEDEDSEQSSVEKRIEIEILKASDEEQTVSGVVLQPEVVDAHGDIMSADVIKQAAYGFLQNFNRTTKLGVQHSTFPKGKLALVESYIAPNGIVLGAKTVRQGSWIMTVKVLDADIWKKVKDGKIGGFSIGGRAKVVKLEE
jgi:hypothetical protein